MGSDNAPEQTARGLGSAKKADSPMNSELNRLRKEAERLEVVVSELGTRLSPVIPQEPEPENPDKEVRAPTEGSSVVTTQVREATDIILRQIKNLRRLERMLEI